MGAENNLSIQVNQIADELADRGCSVVDGFLNAMEVQHIVDGDEFKSGKLHFKKAGIGREHSKQVIDEIRGDYIHWIDANHSSAPVNVYVDRIKKLIPILNQSLFLSLKDIELHLTIYPVGSFYRRHRDQFKSDDHRKLSVICYLNDGWKDENGGQLRVYFQEGAQDILPVGGRLVCFRSDLVEHEVLPANRERLSLTGWMVDRALGVP